MPASKPLSKPLRNTAIAAALASVCITSFAATPASQLPVTAQQRSTAQKVASQGIPEGDLAANAPDTYVVKRGDTLWDISRMFLKQPWRWPELWGMNLKSIANPHLIYPGQTLYLERKDGFARLVTSRNGEEEVVRISPRVRSESLSGSALPAVNQRLIEAFLVEPEVLAAGESDKAPRLVGLAQPDRQLITTGDRIYGRSADDQTLEMGDERRFYRVFRNAVPLKDPETGNILGYEAQYLGKVQLVAGERKETTLDIKGKAHTDPVPATLEVVSVKEEIRVGDRLLPLPVLNVASYVPHAPDESLQASVVSIYGSNSVAYASRNNVISINRGQADGVELGHVFRLMTRGARILDKTDPGKSVIKLPNEPNGLAMVFRTFDKVSYALILETKEGVKIGDALVSPDYRP
ncbi:LysM peptidoglycan-binding domain-containing protein [Comamonas sp. J-3]|uniref:LysM peptidoglycan-binding domain-containing protein n=1 Tax=Comamonas trifloxystrobinivorans TaxID=3350256 RepID=UPI0037281BA8